MPSSSHMQPVFVDVIRGSLCTRSIVVRESQIIVGAQVHNCSFTAVLSENKTALEVNIF